MFCAEGESTAFKSQEANKDMVHFQMRYDAAQVAFWFHLAEVNGEERIHIRQKGFDGEVLDCCCELIPGDCRGNPVPICESLLDNVAHYEAVCLGKRFRIDLNIYDGLKNEFGGDLVQAPIDIGAITVANKNDTDGDGIIDNVDDIVKQNIYGRDEVDLMRLDLSYSGRNRRNIDEVSLELEGDIKLWEKVTKEIPAQTTYTLEDLPKTIYIEALSESQNLQDISIKAIADNRVYSEVKATAIWVKKVSKTVNGKTPYPNSIVNNSLAETIKFSKDGSGDYYGVGKFNTFDSYSTVREAIGGRILLEYQLFPAEASSLGLYLDITRRLEEIENGNMTSGANTFSDDRDDFFSEQVEKPNDDKHNSDEDISTSFPRLFSYDGPSGYVDPGYQIGQNVFSFKVWEGNFEEFVRVSFKPLNYEVEQQEVGPILGTRCSDTIQWQHRRLLKITSNSAEDPYSPPNLVYEQVTQGYSASTPNIYKGTGRGEITINLNPNGKTEGYRIFFLSDTVAYLYNLENELLGSSNLNNNGLWELVCDGLSVTINNSEEFPYLENDVIYFSALERSDFELIIK